jgi:2-polyprenyl-3-methyl-5-hydroxy-6-metoxy-1,4-benzoquinol methylase
MTRPEDFEALYARNPDPWNFASSAYEHEKYDATIAAIGGRRYGNAMEVGCSIGVLTARLAAQCGRLLAVDIADTALASARARCAHLPHVTFENRRMPHDWPQGETFDLIVLSEVLYFLAAEEIRRLATLARGGHALLVNYTEKIDEPCSGDEAAAIFIAASEMSVARHIRGEKYRIDLLEA